MFNIVSVYYEFLLVAFIVLRIFTCNQLTVAWNPIGPWDGPPAVVYFNFDTLTGLRLMSGSVASNYEALVNGKVNRCVRSGKCKSMC